MNEEQKIEHTFKTSNRIEAQLHRIEQRLALQREPVDVIRAARDHLSAIMVQVAPSDDEIIIGHVRDALGILTEWLKQEREIR